MSAEEARLFARTVLSRDSLLRGFERVAPVLESRGVRVMPLKGLLLACCLPDALDRPLADIDILVPSQQLPRALATLTGLGGRALPGRPGVRKCVVAFGERRDGWNVDVHADLWPRYFIPLDVEAAWAASTPVSFAGATVWIPPRRFAFAHMAAHFARSGHGPTAPPRRAEELAIVLDWTLEQESAPALVAYLAEQGATAAAAYALAAAHAATASASVVRVADQLPIEPWRARVLRALATGPARAPHLARQLVTSRGRTPRGDA